jgi:hypothetical protein
MEVIDNKSIQFKKSTKRTKKDSILNMLYFMSNIPTIYYALFINVIFKYIFILCYYYYYFLLII